MINKLKLGIVYKNKKIINHRSLLKVILNPFLRLIGLCIGSHCNHNKLYYPVVFKCKKEKKLIFSFEYNRKHDYIVKKRVLI